MNDQARVTGPSADANEPFLSAALDGVLDAPPSIEEFEPPGAESTVIAGLLECGKLNPNDLGRARRLAEENGDPILRLLVRLGLVSERDMARALADELDLPLVEAASFPQEPVLPDTFSQRFLKDSRVLPLKDHDDLFDVAVGILAQRLVRRLCPHCREAFEALPEVAAKFAKVTDPDRPVRLYRPVGCDQCNHVGYRGRLVITEVLLTTDAIRRAILSHATATEIQRVAVEEGMLTMYDDGLRKAMDGRTTIEEVLRVAEKG